MKYTDNASAKNVLRDWYFNCIVAIAFHLYVDFILLII